MGTRPVGGGRLQSGRELSLRRLWRAVVLLSAVCYGPVSPNNSVEYRGLDGRYCITLEQPAVSGRWTRPPEAKTQEISCCLLSLV